jgi:hypothetical protein
MPMGGGGADRTAGAASFVMEQVVAGASMGSQTGPSYDAALENAIEDGGKDVVDAIKKASATKK